MLWAILLRSVDSLFFRSLQRAYSDRFTVKKLSVKPPALQKLRTKNIPFSKVLKFRESIMFIALIVFCVAALIAKVSEEEIITVFATTVALVCMVLGLILAPWFIQLSALISAFFWQSSRHPSNYSNY